MLYNKILFVRNCVCFILLKAGGTQEQRKMMEAITFIARFLCFSQHYSRDINRNSYTESEFTDTVISM
jgi:hypothetical protein